MSYRPIHQHGVEVAWRFEDVDLGPDAQPVGPTAGLPPFETIATSAQYAYHGPRTLDAWDHAFLYCLAEANLWRDRDHRSTILKEVPQRSRALFVAAASHRVLLNADFRDRASFYGLEALVGEGQAVMNDPDHPLLPEVQRLRDEFGVEEGTLEH